METLDFSISFGQNSLESISDRCLNMSFSRHRLLLPFFKSTFICSPVMGIYFLLALYTTVLLCAGIRRRTRHGACPQGISVCGGAEGDGSAENKESV